MKMIPKTFARLVPLIVILHAQALNAADAPAGEPKPHAGLAIWDIATPATAPLSSAALAAKEGFSLVPQGEAKAIGGDAVLSNGSLTAVIRKQSASIDVYSTSGESPVARGTLTLFDDHGDGMAATKLLSAVIDDNSKGSVCVEATYSTAAGGGPVSAKFRLKKNAVLLEVEPGPNAKKLRIDCASQFAVLPDFFADDMVINPQKIQPNSIEVPSENFLLQMIGNGEAMLMTVFESRKQDAKLALEGAGEKRQIIGSEIDFGKMDADGVKRGGKVWLSVFEGPQIWHTLEVKAADAGKVIPLDWKMPLPAVWRVDFTRSNDLTDSWSMLLQEKSGGEYSKPSWLSSGEGKLDINRKRWNTVLGTFVYPAWSDSESRGFLQPLKSEKITFSGPVVIYPIARTKQTPRDAFTVFDVIRNSLGVGPCEYILDLEGQKGEYRGRATCSTRDTLTAIYKANQQKEKRAQVDKTLDETMAFCTHIRGRITRYLEFGHKLRAYLAEQKAAHPEMAAYIDEMDKVAAEIDAKYDARKEKIQTLEYVAQLNSDFRKNILDDSSPEALDKCKKYAKDLVEVGDNQDELSSECRWVVKSLRQCAGLLLAMDPKATAIAGEIRARTQEALRSPANHEGAQH